jgi:hypothetical protein
MPKNVPVKIVTCTQCDSKYDAAEDDTCPECGHNPIEEDIYADFDHFYDEICKQEQNEDDSV